MRPAEDLLERLGRIPELDIGTDVDLSRLNTFRIGGPADILVEVPTEAALSTLLFEIDRSRAPFQLLGLGSNVLVPDDGLRGVVARLVAGFKEVRTEDRRVWAGGAVTLAQIARRTAAQGLSGLEPLSGFPSTVGGAVFMNAGCYGTEIKDLLVEARVVGADGEVTVWTPEDLEPRYRSTRLQQVGGIVVSALFELVPGDAKGCLERIDELNRKRWESLPSGHPNVGSIFRNPPGDYAGRMIDECGLKGLRKGGAEISSKHGNVIVNLGDAKAADVLGLMLAARAAVKKRFDVRLEPEVVLTGELEAQWEKTVERAPQAGKARL
ncbi:MAG: UDP-N-acetylmuramate dehydrogenase [Acidobacteriota bacterium]|nr:UDP-N-acetylmuramate dehydrogenase [Acidobacteriota bacterium]